MKTLLFLFCLASQLFASLNTNGNQLSGTTLADRPATCTIGYLFRDEATSNMYQCTSTDSWTSFNSTYVTFVTTGAASGDVVGPSSSVNDEVALFSGTTGKLIKRATQTGVLRGDAGVISVDADVTDLVTAATTSTAGKSALATTTEVLTGTETTKANTPDALAALWEQGSNIASAGTISIGEGGYFHITGTTGITDIDFATDKTGRRAILIFDGALTLTHSGTTLILPGAANITTAAGDMAEFVSEGSDAVRCTQYWKAAAPPVSGTNTGDNSANSSTMFVGTTSHALNRASASEVLTGITSIDGVAEGGTGTADVTNAMHANYGALSVSGRSANSAGVPADIAASAASGAVLRESGSTIGFGTVATAGIANNAVDNTKQSQLAANTIKANNTGSTANAIDATAVQVKTMLNVVNDAIVSASAGINTTETLIVKNTAMAASRMAAKTLIHVHWDGSCTSTAANTSTFRVRIGTAGTTSDGVIFTAVTGAAQTSGTAIPFSADAWITVRTTGASASIHGVFNLLNSGTTGIATVVSQTILPTFATFNSTTANLIIDATYQSAASTTTSTFQNAFIEFVNL